MKNFFLFDPKLLIYGFLIVFFASFGQTFFISLFNEDIRNHYKLSDGEFGLVYAFATTISSLLLVFFAKLIDFIDLRLYSFFVSLGLFFSCIGMYFFYQNVFYLILIIFALRFFGQGAMSHAGETSMARYFGNNRGKAISISTFGGMLGVMLLPMIVVKLSKVISIQNIWLMASISIIFFIPLIFFILNSQTERHANLNNRTINDPLSKKWKIKEVLTDKKFYIYLPLTVAFPFIGTGLMFHQIFIINQKNWSFEMLGNSYIFFGFFSILGLLIGGPVIDKFDTKRTVLFSLLPLFIGIIVLLFFENYLFLIVYMSLYGFNMGISAPFIGALWAELYGVESLGSIKALLHASAVFGSALSPLVFGYLIDWGFGILTIVIISALIIIFATLIPLLKKDYE